MELVNTVNDYTIGYLDTDENGDNNYQPIILWNLKIESYISDPELSYRAYGCTVKMKGKQAMKTFNIFIKEGEFNKFERVRAAIVAQTHGELILNSRFDQTQWSDFVPRLMFDCSDRIQHQRPARNIGLQWNYLVSQSFEKSGVLQVDDVEIVYKDVVYNGFGEKIEKPVNVLVPEAFPNKVFRVSAFKESGLKGYLKCFLPPFTSTSKFRRDQQTLAIIGATGQHFYRLIVHNLGSCPSLMLASYEPETQKSTAALVGLKTVSDPLQFFNLQSSTAAVLEQRATSSLPTVYDDVEGESGQHKLMVGSMNGASKFTKGEGEEQQLGGTIYTKNLKLGMKMPAKIVEGRNNWLLMERDPTYEEEDVGENCDQNFDHCNEMNNILMPRDFLASLVRYFIREENGEYSFFQEAQREACEIIALKRPNWGKRKTKSAALFLSIFFLIEKEVAECGESFIKELFVEIFLSRDDYIDMFNSAMDRIDEVEAAMREGSPMNLPAWIDERNTETEDEHATASRDMTDGVDEIVQDTLRIMAGLNDVDKSKYVKVFTNNEATLAIQHTKVKSLAKEIGATVPKFKAQKKNYPSFVKLKTETFTKMTASSSKGSANTGPGFCTAILIAKLSDVSKAAITDVLGYLEVEVEDTEIHEQTEELDPTASKDYPEFSQTQSTETLKVCEVCSFTTRSKMEFNKHVTEHPKCAVCKQTFLNMLSLNTHMEIHITEECPNCGLHIAKVSMRDHVASHEVTSSYKKNLASKPKKRKAQEPEDNSQPKQPRLNSFHVYCRAFRENMKQQFPQLDMLGINQKLRDNWHKLTPAEKEAFKPVTEAVAVDVIPSVPPVIVPPPTQDNIVPTVPVPQPEGGQMTIAKCTICGRMFLGETALNKHKADVHPTVELAESVDNDVIEAIAPKKILKMYKMKNAFWPCWIVSNSGAEIVTIEVYDDAETRLDVEVCKLKPFENLTRIPRSRTAEWRRAYDRALSDNDL